MSGFEIQKSVEWCACDSTGHLAVFAGGRADLVPVGAEFGESLEQDLIAGLVRDAGGRFAYNIDDLLKGEGHKLEAHLKEGVPIWNCLLECSTQSACAELVNRSASFVLPVRGAQVVFCESLPADVLELALESKWLARGWVNQELRLYRVGIFCYYLYGKGGQAEHFRRESEPSAPLCLEDLPPDLASRFRAFRCENLSFAEEQEISADDLEP